jgi:hypothetical protein
MAALLCGKYGSKRVDELFSLFLSIRVGSAARRGKWIGVNSFD